MPGHFLPDDGSSGARGTTQKSQLEGGPGQGFTGDGIILLDNNCVERRILKTHRLALAAVEDDCLPGGLFHLEPRGRLDFLDGELTGIQPLALLMELDLAVGIGDDLAKIIGVRRIGSLAVGSVGHMKTRPLDRSAGDTVYLINGEFGGLVVLERHLFFIAGIERDGLHPVGVLIGEVVGGRDGQLRDLIGSRLNPQGDGAVLAGGHVMLIIAVHSFDPEHGAGDRGGRVRGVYFCNRQLRLLEVVKNQLTVIAGAQPDGLSRLRRHHIGVRDRDLRHLVAVNRKAGQGRGAIRSGGHVHVVAVMDASDFKHRAGDYLTRLSVTLEDGEGRKHLIHRRDGYGAASVHSGLIHMGDDRLLQFGIRGRDRYLEKGVHPLGDIGNDDAAVRVGGLRGNHLGVFDHIEHGALDGVV